jgi:hypothetical protein
VPLDRRRLAGDALEPSGDASAAPETFLEVLEDAKKGEPKMAEWFAQTIRSPDALADHAVSFVLMNYNKPPMFHETWEQGMKKIAGTKSATWQQIAERHLSELQHSYYGMVDARRALAMKPESQGGKS